MKRYLVSALVVVVTFAMAVSAFAVAPGKTVEFDGKGAGKVVFDGKAHADSGNKCGDCHKGLFKMKKGAATITMKEMDEGKFCGECHNGTKAFSSKDPEKCVKCHTKTSEAQKELEINGKITQVDKTTSEVTFKTLDGEKVTVCMEDPRLIKGDERGKTGEAKYVIKDGKKVGTKLRVNRGC